MTTPDKLTLERLAALVVTSSTDLDLGASTEPQADAPPESPR